MTVYYKQVKLFHALKKDDGYNLSPYCWQMCFDNEFYDAPAPCCPDITASADAAICIGQSTNLSVVGEPGYTYTWSPAIGLSCITCTNPTASPAATTIPPSRPA